ncbi:MAG: hypothetical protein AB9891_21340 [Anaerolineaceae bacterium]
MGNWQKHLNGNLLPWLLEPENPSVRYWTLIDLLDKSEDDSEVQETRQAIANQPLVMQLFNLQHTDGHWGEDAAKPYTAEGAVTALSLLFMHGVIPDKGTSAGVVSFLDNCQNECGGFSLIRKTKSGIFPCTSGEHLPFLVYFGFGDDPRVRAAFNFVIEDMQTEDALDCGRYQHRNCLWGAIAALNGLAVLPAEMQSERSRQVVKRLANILLDARLDFEGEHKRWLTFGVPRVWDLISALKALAYNGFGGDPRFQPLLERVLAVQDGQDGQERWLCGSVSRTWPIEKRGQPSKWVTLDVMRALKKDRQ